MTPWRVLARICMLTDLGSTDRDSRSAFRSANTKIAYFTLQKIISSGSGLWSLILYSLSESALYQKSKWCMYSQKWNCATSFRIPTFMYLWAIYIFPGSVYLFGCSKIGGPILGIHKSLTDTWMWNWQTKHYNYDLEITRPRSFISGNT